MLVLKKNHPLFGKAKAQFPDNLYELLTEEDKSLFEKVNSSKTVHLEDNPYSKKLNARDLEEFLADARINNPEPEADQGEIVPF